MSTDVGYDFSFSLILNELDHLLLLECNFSGFDFSKQVEWKNFSYCFAEDMILVNQNSLTLSS